ncbi:MAG: histidine phosphatase family protein, partial [Gammaproteobacteria bacterium]|nr:histidine phosphatase family protein [Gammaproteobacteria bacterium]
QIDDPLSDKGWQQMREAVADHAPWDQIISSPLSRCTDFANELSERHNIPLVMDERLMELSFGDWEGKSAAELMDSSPDILLKFWSDPVNHCPPNGERLADFQQRIIAAWDEIIGSYAGQHILIVGHAGQMRMVIRHVLGMPLDRMFRLQIPNAGISRIQIDGPRGGKADEMLPRLIFHDGSL